MTDKEIIRCIRDTDCTDHSGWRDFVKEMDGRDYSTSALNTAWAWFKVGYEAASTSWRLLVPLGRKTVDVRHW